MWTFYTVHKVSVLNIKENSEGVSGVKLESGWEEVVMSVGKLLCRLCHYYFA